MTPDPMVADIYTAVSALVRWQAETHGHPETLQRFTSEPWTVRLEDATYVVRFDLDGSIVAMIPEDDVAWAVGVLRAHREARRAQLN